MIGARVTKDRYTIDPLYQWDKNQVLQIYGLSLPSIPEIHFSNKTMNNAIVKQASMDKAGVVSVDIPNSLLEQSHDIIVYICTYEGDAFKCLYKMIIPVHSKKKPDDYITPPDDDEIYSYNALENLFVNSLTLSIANYEKARADFNEARSQIAEQVSKALTEYFEKNTLSEARIGVVELLSSKWVGSGNLYSQVVTIDGVTENSQVDLTPSVEQLVIFYEKDLTFVTENEGGVVTVYAIGQKPTNDYTIQVTITEVK